MVALDFLYFFEICSSPGHLALVFNGLDIAVETMGNSANAHIRLEHEVGQKP